MKRIKIEPRKDWQTKVESFGFSFHSLDCIYWNESAAYSFKSSEIDLLEKATNELNQMCLDTVQEIIDNKLYSLLAIPEAFVPLIERTWNNDEPAIYGRFDFSYGGQGVPKLLEYNADTPTSLLESSIIQYWWLQDYNSKFDQFNSIDDKLIDYWKMLKDYLKPGPVYFSSINCSTEDIVNTEYMQSVAEQAGLDTKFIYVEDIGWDNYRNCFTDLQENQIKNIFKLYPWEWMIREEFNYNLLTDVNKTFWIEPAWKMILSNKGFLPLLYQWNKSCPYLLPTYFEDSKHNLTSYAKKPLLSREGANIVLVKDGKVISESEGDYGTEGFIVQELCELPNFDNNFPLIGSWVIGGESAGIGIRESSNLITGNRSSYIPHFIED